MVAGFLRSWRLTLLIMHLVWFSVSLMQLPIASPVSGLVPWPGRIMPNAGINNCFHFTSMTSMICTFDSFTSRYRSCLQFIHSRSSGLGGKFRVHVPKLQNSGFRQFRLRAVVRSHWRYVFCLLFFLQFSLFQILKYISNICMSVLHGFVASFCCEMLNCTYWTRTPAETETRQKLNDRWLVNPIIITWMDDRVKQGTIESQWDFTALISIPSKWWSNFHFIQARLLPGVHAQLLAYGVMSMHEFRCRRQV